MGFRVPNPAAALESEPRFCGGQGGVIAQKAGGLRPLITAKMLSVCVIACAWKTKTSSLAEADAHSSSCHSNRSRRQLYRPSTPRPDTPLQRVSPAGNEAPPGWQLPPSLSGWASSETKS